MCSPVWNCGSESREFTWSPVTWPQSQPLVEMHRDYLCSLKLHNSFVYKHQYPNSNWLKQTRFFFNQLTRKFADFWFQVQLDPDAHVMSPGRFFFRALGSCFFTLASFSSSSSQGQQRGLSAAVGWYPLASGEGEWDVVFLNSVPESPMVEFICLNWVT